MGASGEDNPVRQCKSLKWTRCRFPSDDGLRNVCDGKTMTDSVEGSIVVGIWITVIAAFLAAGGGRGRIAECIGGAERASLF
jgi:hypothetical protein